MILGRRAFLGTLVKAAAVGATLPFSSGCEGDPAQISSDGTPKHPDSGPSRKIDAGDTVVQRAIQRVGNSFDMKVDATKDGQNGCSLIRVQKLQWSPVAGSQNVAALTAEGRWNSRPKTGGAPSKIAYRSGDFPLHRITTDYPTHGTLGLRYLITGRLDLDTMLWEEFLIQNVDLDPKNNGKPSNTFLTPVYTSQAAKNDCLADSGFSNEFFVATTAQKIRVRHGSQVSLCSSTGNICDKPVDTIGLTIAPPSVSREQDAGVARDATAGGALIFLARRWLLGDPQQVREV